MPKFNPAYDDEEVEDTSPEQSDDESGTKALISKSVLGGKQCKIGDTLTLKVTAIYDDEIQAEVSGYKEEESDSEETEAESDPTDTGETATEDDMMDSGTEPAMASGPMPAYD